MTGLTFQPTRAQFVAEGLNNRDQAKAMRGQQPVREISVLPFVFVACPPQGSLAISSGTRCAFHHPVLPNPPWREVDEDTTPLSITSTS